ncbi:MAG: OadG family transporter subunit [Fusobacterium sp.]|uniref:OadG family transporter subunit n=1 Tax=Fusobacterium sp. TaxID=68766 RepID=UPI0026DB8C80|nr:OadG family transporter subunit [Fusobacterium sp.]MDO4690004.1 OadG family transporter subunit [Fusobacterium sp.]
MWTSQTMTFYESFITFLIGFTVVFTCLVALALFIIISSKIVSIITSAIPEEKSQQVTTPKTVASTTTATVVKDNQEELENLAVIISAISEEMREPVENFQIVNIKEI